MELCHVKNTGRCRELLYPDAKIYVQEHDDPKRKTRFSLITVKKGENYVNIDSQAPNKAVYEWLCKEILIEDLVRIKPEQKYKDSRFDFYVEARKKDSGELRKIFIEVKGVSLEEEGVAKFPDAPTERGIKHIHELCECRQEGYEAFIIFVIQLKDVLYFEPNDRAQIEFRKALRDARDCGVGVLAYDCNIEADFMELCDPVEVRL